MNTRAVRALVQTDIRLVLRNPGVRLPLIIAPILLLVVLPIILVAGGAGLAVRSPITMIGDTAFSSLAESIQSSSGGDAAGLPPSGRWTLFVLEYFFAPLYLLVPLIVTTVIAADSFAGERDRRTLEALLHTPTTDRELLTAKILTAWLPAMGASVASFFAYGIVANTLAWPYIHGLFFPSTQWLLLLLWVAPPLAALGLGFMVVVSSRVNSLQAAHQLGSLVVLPIMLLLIGVVTGAARLSVGVLMVLGTGLWTVATVLLVVSARLFTRDLLASRL